MRLYSTLLALAGCQAIAAWAQSSPTTSSLFALYTIQADNITAVFTPYGARVQSVKVPDRTGTDQDIVVGYDTGARYLQDSETNHTYFGAVVGRFANRIKNGTFTIDGVAYHIPENDNKGLDTLHGGDIGYDQRNWTVLTTNESSITFTLLDPAGYQGFPGTVFTSVTFSVSSYPSGPQGQVRPRLTSQIVSTALDAPTPIMLANHIYWNLNAFKKANILDDTTLWMPYAERYILIDTIEIPTGELGAGEQSVPPDIDMATNAVPVASEGTLDFTLPKLMGPAILNATGLCGFNCTGIDNAFILDRPADAGDASSSFPVLSAWSTTTGIQMDVSTNQQGLQIYTCNNQNGNIPIKSDQVTANQGVSGATTTVNKYGCFVIETQAWIDGINHPEWGVDKYEIFSPLTGPAINFATYDFSTF